MTTITPLITPPDAHARAAAAARQRELTKPAGALGRLEDASIWMAGVQGACPPAPFAHPRVVIFAGDHGIARAAGTSAYPPEVTAQMVANFVTGGAAANVIARQVGATVRVVDVAVDADPAYLDGLDPDVAARRIQRSCGAIDREDAMFEYHVCALGSFTPSGPGAPWKQRLIVTVDWITETGRTRLDDGRTPQERQAFEREWRTRCGAD